MLLRTILYALVTQLFEGADDAETGVARLDDVVDIALVGSIVRIAEQVFVLLLLLGNDGGLGLWGLGSLQFLAVEHLDGTA